MKNEKLFPVLLVVLVAVLSGVGFILVRPLVEVYSHKVGSLAYRQPASVAMAVHSPYLYTFSSPGTLYEAGDMNDTTSPYWWLNSGGMLVLENGIGRTNFDSLPATNKWRVLYALSNPTDTDNGYHPQNIFRLLTRSSWWNFQQEVYFQIARYNVSDSPNRSESNGILLFNRYQDSQNLYYTGLRVDGYAVIKKKKNGTYYTLAHQRVFDGTYDRTTTPNLLPLNTWVGVRSVVQNGSDGQVNIALYTDVGKTGKWKLVASTTDDGVTYGGAALLSAAYAGIRTDFMDVSFDNYRATAL